MVRLTISKTNAIHKLRGAALSEICSTSFPVSFRICPRYAVFIRGYLSFLQ